MGNEDISLKAGAASDVLGHADSKLARKCWVTPKVIISTLTDDTEAAALAASDGAAGLS